MEKRQRSKFVFDLQGHHPLSIAYLKYWKQEKRRCIEGYWDEGIYMPPQLYFYANFGRIMMNVDGAKTKSVGRPLLRDVEWVKAYTYMEAKGFSGFIGDNDITCNNWVGEIQNMPRGEEREALYNKYVKFDYIKDSDFKSGLAGELKKYEPVRTYICKTHTKNLGKALYNNNSRNVIDIEARRMGKTMFGSNGMVNHNFLFDGATDYDVYLKAIRDKSPLSSETIVGAINSIYTDLFMGNVKIGLDNLPGKQTKGKVTYNSPLSKKYTGSFRVSKELISGFDQKTEGGGWEFKGSRSKLYNRSFADNPRAGNGTGSNLIILDEVGFMTNLKASLGAMKDATYDGTDKFGVVWCTGTGGLGDAAAISDTKEVFFDPESYDCLSFENIWEETKSIGYFVPYTYRLDRFRDKNGFIDMENAEKEAKLIRDKLKKSSNRQAEFDNKQNNPMLPSEAFLIDNSNLFPVPELTAHRDWLLSQSQEGAHVGQCGKLVFEAEDKDNDNVVLRWKPDLTSSLSPAPFRVKKGEQPDGCIQIWEHPQRFNGVIPYGLYIAGTDPYDHDLAHTTDSMGSTFIYKTFIAEDGVSHNWPVAEYTGRPATVKEHHETVRRLLIYYNAIDMYENERNSIKDYFVTKHSLHLLAKAPTILKATENSASQRKHGSPMSKTIKLEMELYLRDELTEDCGDGKMNLHKIKSIPLLEELINYNTTGNFDRVIAYMMVILMKHQNYNIKVKAAKEGPTNVDPFIARLKNMYR